MKIKARQYQKDLIKSVFRSLKKNNDVMIQLPTGGGKTILFSYIINHYIGEKKRVLLIAHRTELIEQAANKIFNMFKIWGSFIKAGYQYNHRNNLQIASSQTIIRRKNINLNFDIIIIDEAHHVQKNNTWGKIIKRIKAVNPDCKILGFTATPARTSKAGFNDMFQDLIQGPTIKELIELGFLVRSKPYISPYIDLSDIKIKGGDYNEKQLYNRYRTALSPENIVNNYQKLAAGTQTILFAINIKHSQEILKAFQDANIKAATIAGTDDAKYRSYTIRNFKEKKTQVLINVGIVTEGFDVPGAETIIIARPTKSLVLFLQMAGRGARIQDGKNQYYLLDFGNCIAEHGLPEQDRFWSLSGKSEKLQKKKVVAVDIETGKEYELFDLPDFIHIENIELKEIDNEVLLRQQRESELKSLIMKYRAMKLPAGWAWNRFVKNGKNKPSEIEIEIFRDLAGYKKGWVYYEKKRWNYINN